MLPPLSDVRPFYGNKLKIVSLMWQAADELAECRAELERTRGACDSLRREIEEARLAIHRMEESSQQKETVLKELNEKLKNQDEQQVCLVVHFMKHLYSLKIIHN